MWDNASDEAYQVKNYFKEYYNFTKAISVLRSFLQNSVTKSGGKIVIFIDELDRCKPTYAIQTLEIVKHLFNIEGLVFVFSLDLEQLSYCVQTVYGEKIDAIGYAALPRLVQCERNLCKPSRRLGGNPAVFASHRAAVSWSYDDLLPKASLDYALRQGL